MKSCITNSLKRDVKQWKSIMRPPATPQLHISEKKALHVTGHFIQQMAFYISCFSLALQQHCLPTLPPYDSLLQKSPWHITLIFSPTSLATPLRFGFVLFTSLSLNFQMWTFFWKYSVSSQPTTPPSSKCFSIDHDPLSFSSNFHEKTQISPFSIEFWCHV